MNVGMNVLVAYLQLTPAAVMRLKPAALRHELVVDADPGPARRPTPSDTLTVTSPTGIHLVENTCRSLIGPTALILWAATSP